MGENLLHVVSRGPGVGDSLQNWASRPPYLRLDVLLTCQTDACHDARSFSHTLPADPFLSSPYTLVHPCVLTERHTCVYTVCHKGRCTGCSFSAIRITPSSRSPSCLPGLPVPSWPPLSRASMAAQHKVSLELPCWLWVVWSFAQFCSPGAQRVPGSPRF